MTTLQEAAKLAIEALTYCEALNSSMIEQKRAALNALRAALAQQGERKNCPQPEICGSKECEFCRDTAAPQAQQPVAYITPTEQGPMVWTQEMYDEACTYCDDGEFPVPLYTAAPAPQAQSEKELEFGFDTAPQPAQGVPEVGFGNMPYSPYLFGGLRFKMNFDKSGNATNFHGVESSLQGAWVALVDATDNRHLQSAQLVTQPLAKTCDTCAHYQQGKHPGVSIHDETCYECRSYWGNKWEAA